MLKVGARGFVTVWKTSLRRPVQGRALGRIFCPPGGKYACARNYTGSWFAEWANEYSFMVYFMGCISVGEPVCTVTPCFRLFKMQGGCIAALLPTTLPVDMPWSQGREGPVFSRSPSAQTCRGTLCPSGCWSARVPRCLLSGCG